MAVPSRVAATLRTLGLGRLHSQIMAVFGLGMVAFGVVVTLLVQYWLSEALLEASQERGHVVATVLAQQLSDPVRRQDWATVELLIESEGEHSAYVALVAPDGSVRWSEATPEPDAVGAVLGRSAPSQFTVDDEAILDVPARIDGGALGTVHVGVSLEPVRQTTLEVVRYVLFGTLGAVAASAVAIFFLAGLITRPVRRLTNAAQRMGQGDLDAEAPVVGADELANLARTFNEMAAQIRARVAHSEELREYFGRLLDEMPSGLVVCDEDGEVEYSNGRGQVYEGLAARLCGELLSGTDARSDILSVAANRTCELDDGRTLEAAIVELPADGGRRRGVVTFTDVTEKRQLTQRLQQAERLAVAGEVAAGVVHAINNPLDGVRRALGLAQRQPLDPKRTADMLELAVEGTDRIAAVTHGLLKFARADEREPHLAVAPNVLVEEAARLVVLKVEQCDVSLRLDLAPDLPGLEVDTGGMVEVLVNLLLNALDATAGGGSEVVVRTRAAPGGGVQFLVEDDGGGIPDAVRGRIFEPFFSTKEPGVGTGLGLSMARRIVEAHGGQIQLKTAEARRTVFAIQLPASAARPTGAAAVSPESVS